MFAFGFTWGPIVQWLAFIPLAVASLTCLFVRRTTITMITIIPHVHG
jgi:hypothetical protein